MSISYIYISFINIKTCDKYDASSSANEQIKTYILTTGVKKIQKLLIFTTILGRENTKTLFSRSFFSWGGGGGGGEEKKRRNKVLTLLLKKTAVKMTICLTRFRSKGSLIICEIRKIDHINNGNMYIYSYVYLSISNIYLSVYLYVCTCMYVCIYIYVYMYVSIYLSICLSVCTRISIFRFIFSPPKNGREYKNYF